MERNEIFCNVMNEIEAKVPKIPSHNTGKQGEKKNWNPKPLFDFSKYQALPEDVRKMQEMRNQQIEKWKSWTEFFVKFFCWSFCLLSIFSILYGIGFGSYYFNHWLANDDDDMYGKVPSFFPFGFISIPFFGLFAFVLETIVLIFIFMALLLLSIPFISLFIVYCFPVACVIYTIYTVCKIATPNPEIIENQLEIEDIEKI